MRIVDILRRARRSLTQAKARTILTSLAISVGAFTIALAMAAGNGGRAYLDDAVSGAGDVRSIQVFAQQKADGGAEEQKPVKVGEEKKSDERSYVELTPADRQKISKLDGVERVSPIFGVSVYSVESNGSDQYIGDVSVQSDGTAIELTSGQLGADNEIKQGQIILPVAFVESFGFVSADAAIGKKVTVAFTGPVGENEAFKRTFTIVAVDKESSSSPLAMYTGAFRISNQDGMEISRAQRPEDAEERYFTFMVIAKDGVDVKEVKDAIVASGSYEAMTFEEMRTSVMQVVNIVQYGLMGFGLLAIIASIFGIINTQYISVLERTQQIGLMKALGMRSRDIGRLFRYEAAWIGFLGGLIGVILAFLVTLLNPVIANLLDLEDGTALLQLDILSSAILIAGLVLVAVVSGYFPSRKAAKLDPIEALRTE